MNAKLNELQPDVPRERPAVPSWAKLVGPIITVFATSCLVAAVLWSRHWPLFHDAAIMHYVVFLMDHGWRPYVNIVDINMPGSYMVEWFAVHVFGGGSVAWRCFDIATVLVAIVAACFIPARGDRWAGLLGGIALALFHLSNGPADVGERDWILMVLLLSGFAFYLRAIRSHRPSLFFFFAAISGFASAIKPPALPLALILLLLAVGILRRQRRHTAGQETSGRSYLAYAFAGALLPVVAVCAFLFHYRAFHSFFTIASGLVPFYAASGNLPLLYLLHVALGIPLLTTAGLAFAICAINKTWHQWETLAIGCGMLVGTLLYLSQRKGWQQHKATLFAFLLLFITLQFAAGLKRQGLSRLGSALGLFLLAALLFEWTLPIRHYVWSVAPSNALQADLASLDPSQMAGGALSGNVQCVEMVTGCINTLYNMRLQPATGFLFDSFLFTAQPTAPIDDLRTRFLKELNGHLPEVLVVEASDWESNRFSYERLGHWKAFDTFLSTHYSLQHEYTSDGVVERGSYRLYRRSK